MLYYLFEFIQENYDLPGAGLFKYISFRAGMAMILSLIISILFGNRIISSLKRLQIGETVRELGLSGQVEKSGTPTMGGIILVLAILIPALLLAKLDNIYIILILIATVWMTTIGFVDDYIKVFKKNKAGLHGKFKVIGQVILGFIVGATMMFHNDVMIRVPTHIAKEKAYEVIKEFSLEETRGVIKQINHYSYVKATLTNLPFIKGNNFDYAILTNGNKTWTAILYILLAIFIITAVSNGTNLTDGLDGLLSGLSAIIAATLGVLAYVSGNALISDYLNILYIPYSGELVVFTASFLGACVGFLWHNSYPAKVFMGDTGSLAIGGIIATLALMLRKEWLIPILCGIVLVENLSVILQVAYFKYTKKKYGEGRRIFLMSPIHHHYQKKGMHEVKIVTRFWIIGVMLAVLTIITLKVR